MGLLSTGWDHQDALRVAGWQQAGGDGVCWHHPRAGDGPLHHVLPRQAKLSLPTPTWRQAIPDSDVDPAVPGQDTGGQRVPRNIDAGQWGVCVVLWGRRVLCEARVAVSVFHAQSFDKQDRRFICQLSARNFGLDSFIVFRSIASSHSAWQFHYITKE